MLFDATSFDLDRYFARIGYAGARAPDLETLRGVALHHPLAIPFENLNPLLRRPAPLDIASLQRKMVDERRGGWCFEQNTLLGTALTALGYQVTGVGARVMWNIPEGVATPRTHMVLLVDVGGEHYVVDAGFGGLTLTAPLGLQTGIEQSTPHETFRLVAAGDTFILEARLPTHWKALYRFDLQRQTLQDYELASWYLCTNPASHFLSTLICARVQRDRRYALRNAELSVYDGDGRAERSHVRNRDELGRTLADVFGIVPSFSTELDELWPRISAQRDAAR